MTTLSDFLSCLFCFLERRGCDRFIFGRRDFEAYRENLNEKESSIIHTNKVMG